MVHLSAGALLVLAVSLATTCVQALSAQGSRLLVVADEDLTLDDYGTFWRSLRDRGYSLSFRTPQNGDGSMGDADVLNFDHLLLFAPTSKHFPPELSPQSLYNYVERGRNLFVVLSPQLSEYWRDFAREFHLEFDDRGHHAIDHFAYDEHLDDGSHTTLVVPLDASASPFVSESTRAGPPLLYRGVAHGYPRQPLLANILHASPTAFGADPSSTDALTEETYLTGTSTGLVSSFQAKNNARVTFVGSLDLFSDQFVDAPVARVGGTAYPQSGNAAFNRDISSWTFHERGVLRVEQSAHSRARDSKTADLYRVREELLYTVDVSSFAEGSWGPFESDDLQLEFTMLDPYLRVSLVPSTGLNAAFTRYSARFRAPDQHGVFTLKVDHRRPGWTYLEDKKAVSVTPPRHDEYDRFIAGALPYYGGAASVSFATLAFVVSWALQ